MHKILPLQITLFNTYNFANDIKITAVQFELSNRNDIYYPQERMKLTMEKVYVQIVHCFSITDLLMIIYQVQQLIEEVLKTSMDYCILTSVIGKQN